MKILHAPHPILKMRSEPVEYVDPRTIEVMFRVMQNNLGLAAVQLGVPQRFFIVPGHVFINPKILEFNSVMVGTEGCLSLPGVFVAVTRARHITIEAYNLEGKLIVYKVSGLAARVVQHEIDHLEGRLIA